MRPERRAGAGSSMSIAQRFGMDSVGIQFLPGRGESSHRSTSARKKTWFLSQPPMVRPATTEHGTHSKCSQNYTDCWLVPILGTVPLTSCQHFCRRYCPAIDYGQTLLESRSDSFRSMKSASWRIQQTTSCGELPGLPALLYPDFERAALAISAHRRETD